MKPNVLIAKKTMHQLIKHVGDRKRKKDTEDIHKQKGRKKMHMSNCVNTTYAQAAATTELTVDIATEETQAEIAWVQNLR